MHSDTRPLAPAAPAPLDVADPAPPVVAVCGPFDRAVLARATRAALARRAPLHLVISLPRPTSPWALLLGTRPGTAVAEVRRRAEEVAADLRGRGLHVEVHMTTGRPRRLASGIARTIGGQVIA